MWRTRRSACVRVAAFHSPVSILTESWLRIRTLVCISLPLASASGFSRALNEAIAMETFGMLAIRWPVLSSIRLAVVGLIVIWLLIASMLTIGLILHNQTEEPFYGNTLYCKLQISISGLGSPTLF